MVLIILLGVGALVMIVWFSWYLWKKKQMETKEIHHLVEDIIGKFY